MKKVGAVLIAAFGALTPPAYAQESPPPGAPPSEKSAEPPAPVETIPVKEEERTESSSGPATELERIEVTSQKRVKAQRDIPGSVGAIRGADLEAMRAQSMKDYLKVIPGVSFPDQGDDETPPVIRGIAVSLDSGATAGTTGIYLEDMPFADLLNSSSFPDINPFDLERVEVLKGPQGTLFGSGALAGAVRYVIEKPKPSIWETKVSGVWSQTAMGGPSHTLAGAVNVPLFGDAVALRGVYVGREQGGIYDESAHDSNGNTLRDDKDVDKVHQETWRTLGSWQVLDELKASAFWFNQHTTTGGLSLSTDPQEAHIDVLPFASPRISDFGGGNLTLTYDWDRARVLSTTNKMQKDVLTWQHQEGLLLPALGQQNANEYLAAFGTHVDGWTQELRLMSPEGGSDRWEWLVGGAFLHYGNETWQYSYIGPDQPDPQNPGEISESQKRAAQVFDQSESVAEEKAVFGEITSRLGEHWEATLGARKYVTILNGSGVICGAQIAALFPTSGGCRPDTFSDEAKGVNPKVSIRYQHNANVQVYALAAKGFQFGGIQVNPPAPGFAEATAREGYKFAPYKSSTLWNYETGVRTEWLDRRLRFDNTLFYVDWTDLQLTVVVPLVPTQPDTGFTIIANVARAHSAGLESAFEVLPFAGAKFTSSATWMNSVTDEPFDANNSAGPVPAGTRLPGAPRFQWANVASYEHDLPVFKRWVGGIALTHVHAGSALDNIRPKGFVGGYDTLDARLSFTMPSSPYVPEISAGINNLTDVRGFTYHNDVNGAPLVHFVTPRMSQVSVAWRF